MPNPKRKILKDFVLDEISGVDRPAQVTATMSIIKRREAAPAAEENPALAIVKAFCTKNEDNAQTFSEVLMADRVHEAIWPMNSALSTTIRSIIADSALDSTAKKAAMVTAIDEFSASMQSVVTKGSDPLTKFAMNLVAGNIAHTPTDDEDTTMSKELEKKIDDLTLKLAAAELIAKLSDGEKAFMVDMDDKAKKAFNALSADERKEQMDLRKRNDETIVIDGATISKAAVGDTMFTVLKAQQAQIDASVAGIAKANREAEMAILAKRAGDEFSHLPGTAAEVAEVLKAVQGMPEAIRGTAESILKSAEEMAGKGFTKQGHQHAGSAIGATATEKLDTLAKAHAKEHNLGYEAAYTAVIEQNDDLYSQTVTTQQ